MAFKKYPNLDTLIRELYQCYLATHKVGCNEGMCKVLFYISLTHTICRFRMRLRLQWTNAEIRKVYQCNCPQHMHTAMELFGRRR